MQLNRALNKVRSALQFNRVARLLGVKKISYKQDLFSNQYHEKYIKYTQLPEQHLVVRSNQTTLFGINGALPHFILDWLKEAYLKSNRAYLRFLAIFDDTFVKQSVKLASYDSIVYRAELSTSDSEQAALKQSYFQSLTDHYHALNMLPSTLVLRAESNSLNNLSLLLNYYFPYQFAIEANTIEQKNIPKSARSRLGQCQLGQGAILGARFFQLGCNIKVSVKIDNAALFSQIERQAPSAVAILQTIKSVCNHYVNHEVVVNVEAEYTGLQQSNLALTNNKQRGLLLGVNSNLATHCKTNKRTVRAL